jgi:hypothetical protein
MRRQVLGTATAWPDRLQVTPASAEIPAGARRLVVSEPIRFGADDEFDLRMLRFLATATSRLAELDWTLAGDPPWPLRTVVHLLPPSGGTSAYAKAWRVGHRTGLCTYRQGPGFIRIRDVRAGGPRHRVLVDGDWSNGYRALAADPWIWPDDRASRLLDALTEAGLAIPVGTAHHVLPVRILRWPIPHTTI